MTVLERRIQCDWPECQNKTTVGDEPLCDWITKGVEEKGFPKIGWEYRCGGSSVVCSKHKFNSSAELQEATKAFGEMP